MWHSLKKTSDGVVAGLRVLMAELHLPFSTVNLFDTIDTLEWIMRHEPVTRVERQATIVAVGDILADLNRFVHETKSAGQSDLSAGVAYAVCELLTDSLHYAKKSGFADYHVHA